MLTKFPQYSVLLFLFVLFSLTKCTGSTSSGAGPQVDGEGIQGKQERPILSSFTADPLGSDSLTIQVFGKNFQQGAKVEIMKIPCTDVNVPSSEKLSCTLGTVIEFQLNDILVTNPDGQSNISVLPIDAGNSSTSFISAYGSNTCRIKNGAAQCWGYNVNGQLGNNSTTDSHVPVQVQGLTSGVTSLSTATYFSCAVVNGSAMCWGLNDFGELGNNSTTASLVPVQVSGMTSGAVSISSGYGSPCAIFGDALKCWGWNGSGQLGNNSTTDSHVPVQVQGLTSGVSTVAVGLLTACAIVNGGAECWGRNSTGQLGNNSTTDSHVPVQVQGLTSGVTDISTNGSIISGSTTCAVVNGSAKCWGTNNYGEVGNGTSGALGSIPGEYHTPQQVSGLTSGVTAITVQGAHGCAIVNGGAMCWGVNGYGQLGNNSTVASKVPVQVQGLTSGVTAISTGASHTCAIANGGTWCWGSNTYGQLGNGTTTDSLIPILIQ